MKIEIQKFEDASEFVKEMSKSGGDEDFVLVITEYKDDHHYYPYMPMNIDILFDEYMQALEEGE